MTRHRLFWVIFLLWLVAYLGSVMGFALTEPTGDGFTRGLNKLAQFAVWQTVAAVIGLIALFAGRGVSWWRWVPLALTLTLVIALASSLAIARYSMPRSPGYEPTGPVTVPAD